MLEKHEILVQSLGPEDPPEEEMASHSSILAWKVPLTKEPGGLQSTGSQRARHNWMSTHTYDIQLSPWQIFSDFLLLEIPQKKQIMFQMILLNVWN